MWYGGEQPLLPFEACVLGSINLAKMIMRIGNVKFIDWDKLETTTKLATRFLDNIIDVNKYPLAQIEEMCKNNRKIGIGVMGLADILIELGIPYDSKEGVEKAKEIFRFINDTAENESNLLASEKGLFPNFDKSIWKHIRPMRNAAVSTIAPTGTLSMLANCSGGCEPVFALGYFKNVMDGEKLPYVNEAFIQYAKDNNFYSDSLIEEVAEVGILSKLTKHVVPNEAKKIFITAQEITPEWHVKMQAGLQEYCHSAISKTINAPREATLADVAEVYMLAYKLKCKGVTVYRDGSREGQVLNIGKADKPTVPKEITQPEPMKRPKKTYGETQDLRTGCGKFYLTINNDGEKLIETFTSASMTGGCASNYEATSRMISLALRSNISVENVVKQLKGIKCAACIGKQNLDGISCPDAIGKALEKAGKEFSGEAKTIKANSKVLAKEVKKMYREIPKDSEIVKKDDKIYCDCGEKWQMVEGCRSCLACGNSKCG